jgi:RNA polymerase sigma factor (sigma-70 family)
MKLFILSFLFYSICGFHLSFESYKIITNLIRRNDISLNQRNKINKIMYISFEKWAIKRAYNFKYKHPYKSARVPVDELVLHSKVGLFKSIKNYNGRSNFTHYSSFYVDNELRKAITDSYSLSILPKYQRIKSKKNLTPYEKEEYKKLLEIDLRSEVSHWHGKLEQNHICENLEDYRMIWEKVNKMDPFVKRIVYLKYDYEFQIIKSNKVISELMCCSSETIRTNLNKFKEEINRTFLPKNIR